jgi:hypothetical protein
MNITPTVLGLLLTIACLFAKEVYIKYIVSEKYFSEKDKKMGIIKYLNSLQEEAISEIKILIVFVILLWLFSSFQNFLLLIKQNSVLSTWFYPIFSCGFKVQKIYWAKKVNLMPEIYEIQEYSYQYPEEVYGLYIKYYTNLIKIQEKKLDLLKIFSPISIFISLLPNITSILLNLKKQKLDWSNVNLISILLITYLLFNIYDTFNTYKIFYYVLNSLELSREKIKNPDLFQKISKNGSQKSHPFINK